VYGDGTTSRDFCFVANVVQANIAAGIVAADSSLINSVANIACGATTSLTQLFDMLREQVARLRAVEISALPELRHEPFRQGDILHSLADISRAEELLGYRPTYSVEAGIAELVKSELTSS
jgi:UDP-N-acetylglucosamine 4-epimerase